MSGNLRFGSFIAPVLPLGENPTLQIRREIELIEHLDRLGFNEAWVGEHHSGGAEIIASPEILLAAAAERTRHIRLGTGVITLPSSPFPGPRSRGAIGSPVDGPLHARGGRRRARV